MIRRRIAPAPAFALAGLAALALGGLLAASAQDAPAPGVPAPGSLEARYATLLRDAQSLVDAYKEGIAEKVDRLVRQDLALARLHEAGMFTAEAQIAGINLENPLLALPFLKRQYEAVEANAADLKRERSNVAKEANEKAAIAIMRKIAAAQAKYRDHDLDGNGINDYAESIAYLSLTGFPRGKGEVTIDGYVFKMRFANPFHWAADAGPERPGSTGDRWFFVDETGIVRAKKGGPADNKCEPVK